MTQVVVPVRYPLSKHSTATLERAIGVAGERDADLTVLHVDLYHSGEHATRTELKRAVERAFGRIEGAHYVVREGFLVEETILEEVADEDADAVVIGQKQANSWRRMVRRITGERDIGGFLREQLDCEIVIAPRE